LTSRPLPGTENAFYPFWSPDSRSIAFFTADKLKRVEISGGSAVTICDGTLGRGGSWNRDGTIIAAPYYNGGIFRIPASGGTPAAITKVDNVTYSSHRWPFVLPDGKHFIYLGVNHNQPMGPNTAIFYASIDGKENRQLFSSLSNAIYAAGHLLFMRENTLMAQPFDPAAGKFTGEPKAIHENVQYDASVWRANLSISDNGMMVFVSGGPSGSQIMAWYDRTGKQLGTVNEPGAYQELELSPDDKKVAVTDSNAAASAVWIFDLEGKPKSKLTYNSGVSRNPTWSPDGREIAFTSHQQDSISALAISGGTPERILLSSSPKDQSGQFGVGGVTNWSRDGRYLMYENLYTLWVLPLFGDRKPTQYVTSGRQGSFSPDGRWVAFTYVQPGQVPQVFVAPFPWTGSKWQVSAEMGSEPRWRADGKEIFYFDLTNLCAAEVDGRGSTFQVGGIKTLFRIAMPGLSMEYSPTNDGQRFIAITPGEGSSQHLNLVQNWKADLTQ
jgi:Tol biopolymer transport system component